MRFSLIFLFHVVLSVPLWGQDTSKAGSVFLEVGGSGGLGSLNYTRPWKQCDLADIYWRAGISFAPIDKNNGTGIVFPLMLEAHAGKNAHQMIAGIGQGLTITTKGNFFALTTASLGYQYRSEKSPWFFRAAYTPLISYLVDFQWQHWGGISIGYTFKTGRT